MAPGFALRAHHQVTTQRRSLRAGNFAQVWANTPKIIPSFFSKTELPRENSVFFRFVDRSAPKNDIRDQLMWTAYDNGEQLSLARANNLADKFKKGKFDPDLARIIQYSDPTGETATRRADKALGLAA